MTRPRPPTAPPSRSPLPPAAATALLGGVLVALNVVIDPAAYDVSQMPRLLALMAGLLVAVATTLGVPALARRLDWRPLGEPLVVAAAGFVAACWFSLTVALNPTAGLTDAFRSLGWFLVLCLCLLLLPLATSWRRRLLETAVVATLVAVGVGVWEAGPLVWQGQTSRRDMELAFLEGMMSNVNLFAGYLLLLLPWCGCAAVELSGGWRIVAGAAAGAGVALVAVLQSRAAWLGLAAAALVCGATILRHARQIRPAAWLSRAVGGGLAGLIVAGLVAGGVAFTDTPVGRAIHRLVVARPHQQQGPSDGGRTLVWGIATDMIAAHPFAGVGAGNFSLRMPEYLKPRSGGPPRDLTRLSSDTWIHPHNDFLEVFAEHGLPGIVAFLAVFLLALVALRRILTGDPSAADARLATASLGALVAYLVFSGLDFPLDRVSHQAVLAVHLGVIVLLDRAGRAVPAAPPRRPPAWLVAPPVAAALLLGIAYAAAAVRQERAVMDARRAEHQGDWQAMREAARRAATPWKTLDPLAVPVAFLEGQAERRLGDLAAATSCFERAVAANPDRRVLQNLGEAYAEAGRLDDAVDVFAIAADRHPDRVELRHNLAMALVDAERFAEAIAVIEDVPEPLRTEGMREALAFARERQAAAE